MLFFNALESNARSFLCEGLKNNDDDDNIEVCPDEPIQIVFDMMYCVTD